MRFTTDVRPLAWALVAALTLGAIPADGQDLPGAGWNAWMGCWQPVVLDPTAVVDTGESAVCVVPGAGETQIEVLTLEDGVVVGRETLDASGAERSRAVEGCDGRETVAWSADGTRVFQRGVYECPGELERSTSGILAINPEGEWVSVEAVTVGGNTDVRVVRYRPAPEVARGNREVASAFEGRTMAIDAARTAAAARADLEDVVEATRRAEIAAVEGWMVEQGHGFDVDASRLEELAATGVPGSVIDLVVALSYPEVFAIDRSSREGELREGTGRTGRRPRGAPWYYPAYGGGYYPGYWGGYYGRPVIIVRDPDIDVDRGGRAVRGRGYTRGGSGSGSSTNPGTASTSTGRSGGGDSGVSGGGRSDTGRTAKPRS